MYTYLRRSERRAVISELLFSKPSAFLFATVRFSSVHLWTVTSITLSSNATNALKALVALILLVVAPMVCGQTVFAQTRESDPGPQASAQQTPEGKARSTEGTVRNPYYNSRQSLQEIEKASRINQQYVSGANAPRGVWGQFGAVDRILTGEQTNVVFQAAEQGKSGDVQRIARNSLNASLGAINSTYTGLHKWYADDIIGNLFTNIGQLAGKWLSELINGWIADTVQYLAQFLRIFVLNPNIAVNGLDGKMNDGISPYIRKGADTMYGIAVDLLLLLFILCIWKHWADASWKGAGNLMAPVGRLIFTAGLLLAWPTICAFEVQITNEMIKAVYFNSNDELARLHFALAITVKGGLIAAGAGALSVFAPIIGAGAAGSAAPFVSSGFYFASIVVFVILGGVLIAELVYLLVLKAIQTALLVAQYMFGPIFLVFFATPSTENIATGYVRSFVETSLWTFVWVGLLKIMVIIIYSNFNPWGKILIAIGILQMMIQVPSFLARAQISPMSDFVSAGLVTGGLTKAMSAVGGLVTTGISTLIGKAIDEKMLQGMLGTTESIQNNLGMPAKAPELTNSLDNASKTERERHGGVGANPLSLSSATGQTGGSPPAKKPTTASAIPSTKMPELTGVAGDESALTKPPSKPDASLDPAGNLGDQDANIEPLSFKPGDKPDAPPAVSQTVAEGKPLTSAPTSPSSPVSSSPVARTKEPADKSGGDSSGLAQPDQYKWKNSDVSGWDESNLVHVPVRKLIGKLTSVDGVGIRKGGKESSVLGTADHGVQRINVAANADDGETARIIYTAAYADMVAHDDPARDAARRAALLLVLINLKASKKA